MYDLKKVIDMNWSLRNILNKIEFKYQKTEREGIWLIYRRSVKMRRNSLSKAIIIIRYIGRSQVQHLNWKEKNSKSEKR
jgi:hypothetical protein